MDEELKQLIRESSSETRRHAEELATGLRGDLVTATAEMRRHFEVTSEDVRHEVRLLAEGLAQTREEVTTLRGEMKEEFGEVRAMIRFSHADLDRRVRTLEDEFADLRGRVVRLESQPT